MPSKYPILTSQEVVRKLEKMGFKIISQRGSHKKLRKENHVVIVPMHPEIAKGTLRSILLQAGIELEDFI